MIDLILPAFEMDCREWLVVTPTEAGMPEDVVGAPLLAVLSSVLIDDAGLREASCSLTVGVIDDDDDLEIRPVSPGASAHELLEDMRPPGSRRYVMPVPVPGQRLAVLAEFAMPDDPQDELLHRVEDLMASFRWQTAA